MFRTVALLLSLSILLTKEEIVACPYGGISRLNGHCLVDLYLATFEEAVTLCSAFNGGSLLSVHSQTEMNRLKPIINTSKDSLTVAKFIVSISSNFGFTEYFWLDWKNGTWLDDSNSTFSLYKGDDFPENLVLSWPSGQWIEPISQKSSTVCNYISDPICGGDKSFQNGKCYEVGLLLQNYTQATKYCSSVNCYITSINSAVDNEFVYSLHGYTKGDILWLGYQTGIGGWTNGSPYNYTNYVANFNYSRLFDTKYCLGMKLRGSEAGKWDAVLLAPHCQASVMHMISSSSQGQSRITVVAITSPPGVLR